MKKFLCLLVSFLCFSAHVYADEIHYLKKPEDFSYSLDNICIAVEKATGKIIPLSYYGEYLYAYTDQNTEFEFKAVTPQKFSDLDNALYYTQYIDEMSSREILVGFDDGTFRPNQSLTRAEMAAVFSRLFSITPSNKKSVFSDVTEDSWYSGYVTALYEKGVFKKDDKFNPNSPVTREQLTAMTYRMLSDMGCINEIGKYDFSNYLDYDTLSDYAVEPYNLLLSNDYRIISDWIENDFNDLADDEYTLQPEKSVTRGECAEFLYNLVYDFVDNNAPAIKRDIAPDEEIPILDGSTSTYNITENIYWYYYAHSQNHPNYPKQHSKTSNAYKRLIDGEVEMIFVPDPSEDIKNYAKEKGVTLKYIPIANEALVFFTSANNRASNITTEQLHDIYVNNTPYNWKELGGKDAELVPYCRNNDSGSHAQMEKFILDGNEINEDIRRERTSYIMSSILTDVEKFNNENSDKYAMGYSLFYYYINNYRILGPLNLKMLSVNNIEPTEESIANGSYPYTTNYYAVIRDEDNPKVEAFAKLMQGEFGQEIIRRSGMGVITNTD